MKHIESHGHARIWQYVQKHDIGFGIITSWRDALPLKENKARFSALKKAVHSGGYGFVEWIGHWEDGTGTRVGHEPVLFIPNRTRAAVARPMPVAGPLEDRMTSWARKFGQDAFGFGDGDTVNLVDVEGFAFKRFAIHDPNALNTAWAAMKDLPEGQTFHFASVPAPSSFMEATARNAAGEIIGFEAFTRFLETGTTALEDTHENRQKRVDDMSRIKQAHIEQGIRDEAARQARANFKRIK